MSILSDPFKLFGKLLLAGFKITGCIIALLPQLIWAIANRQRDRIFDVWSKFVKGVTDAVAEIFN